MQSYRNSFSILTSAGSSRSSSSSTAQGILAFLVRTRGSPARVSATGNLGAAAGAGRKILGTPSVGHKILGVSSTSSRHATHRAAGSSTNGGVHITPDVTPSVGNGGGGRALETFMGSPSGWMHIPVRAELLTLEILVVWLGTSIHVAQLGDASALENTAIALELIQGLNGQSRGSMVNRLRVVRLLVKGSH